MRADWIQKQQLKYESEDAKSIEQLDDTVYTDEVHSYFQRTSPYIGAKQAHEPLSSITRFVKELNRWKPNHFFL